MADEHQRTTTKRVAGSLRRAVRAARQTADQFAGRDADGGTPPGPGESRPEVRNERTPEHVPASSPPLPGGFDPTGVEPPPHAATDVQPPSPGGDGVPAQRASDDSGHADNDAADPDSSPRTASVAEVAAARIVARGVTPPDGVARQLSTWALESEQYSERDVWIGETDLGTRARNALHNAGLHTLGDVMARSPSELAAVPNLGGTTFAEIETTLRRRGLSLAPEGVRRPSVEHPPETAARPSVTLAHAGVGQRAMTALTSVGLNTLEAVAATRRSRLARLPTIDTKRLAELDATLARHGLEFAHEAALPSRVESQEVHVAGAGAGSEVVPAEPDRSIRECALSMRARNTLCRAGLLTLGVVALKSRSELAAIPNIGATTLEEIETTLARYGLSLESERELPLSSPDLADPLDGRDLTLEEAGLGRRAVNALARADAHTLGAIAAIKRSELESMPEIGAKTVEEIGLTLARYGLGFAAESAAEPSLGPHHERRDDMVRRRLAGATLAEIAEAHGVTRERVRQILTKAGVSGRVSREHVSQGRRDEVEARRKDILQAFRRGDTPAETARLLGVSEPELRQLLAGSVTSADRATRRGNQPRRRGPRFSDDELVDAVRDVGKRYGRAPMSTEYGRAAAGGLLPSLPTIHNRIGWSRALALAGFEERTSARRHKRRWTEEACRHALIRLVVESGEVPTVTQYETLAQLDDALPSLGTVRNRIGVWSAVTAELARLPTRDEALQRVRRQADTSLVLDSMAIWIAYLEEEVTVEDLIVLLITDDFSWDDEFGEPPPELADAVRDASLRPVDPPNSVADPQSATPEPESGVPGRSAAALRDGGHSVTSFGSPATGDQEGADVAPRSAGGLSGVKRLQLEFWTEFSEYLRSSSFAPRTPRPKSLYYLPIGTSRAQLVLTVSEEEGRVGCKLAVEHTGDDASTDLATVIFERLRGDRAIIEHELGFADLQWGEPTGTRIYRYHRAAIDDPAAWPSAFAWLVGCAERFKEVFGPRIEQMDIAARDVVDGTPAPTKR